MRNGKAVVVKLPARLDREQVRMYMRQLQPLLECGQPHMVLDLSEVHQLDSAGVDMLLKCLQETMRRDGDVKLANVSPESAIVLELTRTDRLFEIFGSTADAVESFHAFSSRATGLPSIAEPIAPVAFEARCEEREDFKNAS